MSHYLQSITYFRMAQQYKQYKDCTMLNDKEMPLIIDIETTGIPAGRGFGKGFLPYHNLAAYQCARLVQASWLLCKINQGKLETIRTRDFVIRPQGFCIPKDSTEIHGISHEHALTSGTELKHVLETLQADLATDEAEMLIAHNAQFDLSILKSEMHRIKHPGLQSFANKPVVCTMAATTNLCQLPFASSSYGGSKYKYPKQSELYYWLTGKQMENAHNSLHDVNNLCIIIEQLQCKHAGILRPTTQDQL